MISAELPLLMSIRWMLNSSTLSMITNGSSWGYLMPWPSLSEKTISGSLFFGISIGGSHEWMLFISLSYAFFRDFNVSPIVSPLEVVFISPTRGSNPYLQSSVGCPFVGTCVALSFWCTFATSLAGLKSLPGLSNVCTYPYYACGPDGIYSTCSCLFFLMEC